MPQKFDRSLLPDAPDLSFEIVLWNSGLQFVAGLDEAGRGALAGPVAPNRFVQLVVVFGIMHDFLLPN